MHNPKPTAKPTETELRLLKVLWQQSGSDGLSVRQVLEHLDSTVGYTTVLKLLQIMLSKNLVQRDESHRTHRYRAAVARDVVEGGMLTDLVRRLFDGSAAQLVQSALEHEAIDGEELEAIERMIRKARTQQRNETAREGRK